MITYGVLATEPEKHTVKGARPEEGEAVKLVEPELFTEIVSESSVLPLPLSTMRAVYEPVLL